MAQTLKCDVPDCNNNADVMISNIHNGDTQALCVAHFNECVLGLAKNIMDGINARKEETKGQKKVAKDIKPKVDSGKED